MIVFSRTKNAKKLLALLLSTTMAFSLTACGSGGNDAPAPAENEVGGPLMTQQNKQKRRNRRSGG